jgi:acetylornithine deacetylase/succinyl-diaminopimelate desuccinylase-like protein
MVLPAVRATTSLHATALWPKRERWLAELGELLAFPTISADLSQRAAIEGAATRLQHHLEKIGLRHAQILPGPALGAPSVYADWLSVPKQPTILIYGHFDVQPVDPLMEWQSPPFRATVIGENMYARGASDDKGQLFILLKAVESYLATTGRLPVNVKIWLEGEEEIGSPNLKAFLDREVERLRTDAVLVADTEMLGPGRPSIVYGLRGQLAFELEVRGPRHDLHSGRYGGAIYNPVEALCEIIARLHDRDGRMTIPSFYRQVRELEPAERRELRRHSRSDAQLAGDLGVPAGWGERGYSMVERTTIRPALTVNSIVGGASGLGAKAVIPHRALARLSMRLVPDQQPAEVARLLRLHIATISPPTVRVDLRITGGSRPVLISRHHPAMLAAARAVRRTWGVAPVFTRSGGSIAVVEQLSRRLGVPVILLGFGLPDDNIHGPNEKIHLPTFFRGVETVIRFLAEYAA